MKTKARKYVEVFYDPDLKDWNQAINKELKRLGLRHGQATLICRPFKHLKSGTSSETLWMNRADGKLMSFPRVLARRFCGEFKTKEMGKET